MPVLRIVLDANIFVSSLLSPTGTPAAIINAWRDRRYVLCVSPEIIAEIGAVLGRSRLRVKYGISDGDVDDLLELLHRDALVVPGDTGVAGAIPGDPTDEAFLACACDAGADLIVSGDRHLLDLGEYAGIRIVTG